MRKLKLEVDALRVESFVVHPPAAEVGTVHAHLFEAPESNRCDGAGWGSFFGTCAGCQTVGTCIGPTYCCPPTWRPTCEWTCPLSCMPGDCGA